jgi:hypothetical protein
MPTDDDPGSGAGAGQYAAARRLRRLLTFHPEYRARWERHSARHRGSAQIHQAAVAHVLAHHLWDSGQVPENDIALTRRLKDVVSRALSGRVLSVRTLSLITEAFAMSPSDVAALTADRVGVPPPSTEPNATAVSAGIHGPHLETICLHEMLTIGPDGIPTRHRTAHLLRALVPLDSYVYYLDTDRATVTMERGGTCGPIVERDRNPAVTITLASPLLAGETASVEFTTELSHQRAPEPVFLRAGGSTAGADHVELLLQFSPERPPESLWWIRRPSVPGAFPPMTEPVRLDPEYRVHRHLELLAGQQYGFRWRYPDRTGSGTAPPQGGPSR